MIRAAVPPGRDDRQLEVRQFVQAASRNRWLSIGLPLAILASTAFFLWWTAPVYQAATTIRIDEQQSGVAIVEALRTLSSGGRIPTEIEELRSRSLAEQVVDSLALSVRVERPRKVMRSTLLQSVHMQRQARAAEYTFRRLGDGTFSVSVDGRAAQPARIGELVQLPGVTLRLAGSAAQHEEIVLRLLPFADAVRGFRDRLSVGRPNREADLVEISYLDTDRELAQAVPNLVASSFIQRRHAVRTSDARNTADFLHTQIGTLHAQLTMTEDEMRAFQERHRVLGVDAEAEGQLTRLADMQAQRELLAIERDAIASVLAQMPVAAADPLQPSPFRALLGLPTILQNGAASELLRALNEAESDRSRLLDTRTAEEPRVVLLTQHIQQVERQLRDIALTYMSGVNEQVEGLDRILASYGGQLQQVPALQLQLARLRRQARVSEDLYATLQVRLKEAEIIAAMADPSVRVMDPAILPRRPVQPNVPLSLALSLMAGLVIGVGSAVVREQLDGTVRSRDDLQLVGRVPVLAAIPPLDAAPDNGSRWSRLRSRHVSRNGGHTARLLDASIAPGVSEAYRGLRTNLTFAGMDRPARSLVITSAAPGDGKSTTAANLGIVLVQQGHRCLLIDADMRRGRLHELFGCRREPGLSNVLLGEIAAAEAIVSDSAHAEWPSLLPTGTIPPNPAELLGAERMRELLATLLEQFDTVIMDAPPLNIVTDAAVLARHADGVVVVARAGATQQAALSYTFEQLSAVRAHVLGTVLNNADPQRERHYGSYMREYYQAQS